MLLNRLQCRGAPEQGIIWPKHLQLTGSVPWADDKMSFTDSSENQGYDRPGSQGGPEDYMR